MESQAFNQLVAAAAAGLAFLTAPAAARDTALVVSGTHEPEDPDTIRVGYGDLDMASPGAGDELRARFRREARETCERVYEGAFRNQVWGCQDMAWRIGAVEIANVVGRARKGLATGEAVLQVRLAIR